MQYKLHSGQCDVYIIFKHLIYVLFLESHLCRIRYHMRRMSHLLIAINTASASTCRIRRYVAFVECKLSLIWSLHLLHPGELQVTKTARYLRLQTSRTCYLTSASRSRARAEYARIPPHFLLVIEESRVYVATPGGLTLRRLELVAIVFVVLLLLVAVLFLLVLL